MKKATIPDNELKRLNELKSYKILDTPNEEAFDDITHLATIVADCDVALISFVDKSRVWFKSSIGFGVPEVPFDISICPHANYDDGYCEISDLTQDERFKNLPFVVNEPNLRFYAGVPLIGKGANQIGTLCVLSPKSKKLTKKQIRSLKALARQTMFILEAKSEHEQFSEAQKVAQLGSWSFDIESEKISWSDQLFRLFGLDPSKPEPTMEEHLQSIYQEDRELWLSKVHKCLADGESYEMEFRGVRPCGKVVWLKAFGQATKDEDGKVVSLSGTCQDITEAKKLEIENKELGEKARKMLEEQKLFLSNTLDNMPAVIYAKDIDGRFIAINDSFKKLFNFTDDQVLGKTNHEILPFEIAEEFRKNDLKIINTKKVMESEEKAIGDDGKEHIYHSFKFPYFDKDGKVIATGGISLDITEKKEFERQAFHNSKLASIGELAAGVGHEINNPLTIIKGYIGSIQYKMESDQSFDKEACQKYLEKIDSATNRIAKIVQGLRNFSRSDGEEFSDFELSEAITESVEMVKDIYYKEGITVSLDSSAVLGVHIYGSIGKIQQVFMNLLSNARDATSGKEERTILISSMVIGKQAFIIVKDNGVGISNFVQNKIFDPFFTTKEVNQGTGIGLSIAHNIMDEHGGSLSCESREGEGATFIVELPISFVEETKDKEEIAPKENLKAPIKCRAILADDEEGIRQILKEMLEGMGVSVSPVQNGKEALELYLKNQEYDLIVSDIKMPVMDGTSLLKEIRHNDEVKTQPKIVMVTGGINIDFEDKNTEYGKLIDGYLLKPFDKDKVYEVVRSAINKKR